VPPRSCHQEDVAQEVSAENFNEVFWSTRGFRWWSWVIGSAEARQLPDQTPHASYVTRMVVDGRTFVADFSLTGQDGGRGPTPSIELLPTGELRPGLTARGEVGQISRVR
jgi:hypothetical protein